MCLYFYLNNIGTKFGQYVTVHCPFKKLRALNMFIHAKKLRGKNQENSLKIALSRV